MYDSVGQFSVIIIKGEKQYKSCLAGWSNYGLVLKYVCSKRYNCIQCVIEFGYAHLLVPDLYNIT